MRFLGKGRNPNLNESRRIEPADFFGIMWWLKAGEYSQATRVKAGGKCFDGPFDNSLHFQESKAVACLDFVGARGKVH